MDFRKLKQVHDSNSRAIDSNSPKHFDLNLMPEIIESDDDDDKFSELDNINTSQASQNPTEEVNTNANGLAPLPVSCAEGPALLDGQPSGSGGSSAGSTGRTLCPRRPEVNNDGHRRVCTNYYCRTKNTPMWRKGPLGPKTLCNACGIQFKKQVASRGSNR